MTPGRATAAPTNWGEFQTFAIDTSYPPLPAARVAQSPANPGILDEVLTPPQVADWLQVPSARLTTGGSTASRFRT